jgi:phosphate:Na+ symporter
MFKSSTFSERPLTGRAAMLPLLGAIAWLACFPVFAAEAVDEEIDWWTMGMTLLGGLALFLFGMEQMADALKKVAGDSMKRILARLTSSRIMGLITGAFVTAVIQSSSVTTVMLVGFVTANLMSLSQAIGVILGADIGTTITAQIVAFKVTKYALLLVAVGFLFIFTGKTNKTKQYGHLIMGLGLIFFGMGVMSEGMRPLRTYEPFIDLMQNVSNPVIGILLATAFTGLVQSSSATMGVVIALALQGLISLEGGIALALGANIGTCVTAGLASIGKPREAIRVAVAHVTFKVVGVLLIVAFIPALADLVRAVSPVAAADLTGADRLAAETPRQIANAHTIFNVGIAFLFLPLAGYFARFCEWVVPDKPLEEVVITRAKYLDEALITTPALALDRARLEIGHMGECVKQMVDRMMPTVLTGDQQALTEIARMDDEVDILHGKIVTYMGRVSRQSLTDSQSEDFAKLMDAVNDLENIGDIIETDLVALGRKRIDANVTVSEATQEVLASLHKSVAAAVERALHSLANNDQQAAQDVIFMKSEINRLVDAASAHQTSRLVAEEPNRLAAYSVEVDVIEKLKRIYYFAKRIAKAVVPEEVSDKAA